MQIVLVIAILSLLLWTLLPQSNLPDVEDLPLEDALSPLQRLTHRRG